MPPCPAPASSAAAATHPRPPQAKEIDPARKAMQSKVDDSIIAAIGAVDNMKDYLRNSFSLKSGQFPHAMKF